ncbi:hypothetical protein [Bacillus fonticola]|uniref:hypothetical protein n=1 Tax=Bacillus fonticola TaxID=2728853 RepID=UPI00147533D8|nr:hypothetical protein [Bacillus fonticola]
MKKILYSGTLFSVLFLGGWFVNSQQEISYERGLQQDGQLQPIPLSTEVGENFERPLPPKRMRSREYVRIVG